MENVNLEINVLMLMELKIEGQKLLILLLIEQKNAHNFSRKGTAPMVTDANSHIN